MKTNLDWSDYRLVLHIADAGSLSRAVRQSGLSHPTLFRRLNAIEDALGVRLFERFRTGYQTTAAGEEFVAAARRIAAVTNETERRLAGRDVRPSGVVRLATTDTLLFGLLAPEIDRLKRREPGITLDVALSNEISDLSGREADIAIRPASRPHEHLVGRKLGVIRQAIYAQRDSESAKVSAETLRTAPWLGPSRTMPYGQLHAWMKKTGYDAACLCRIDSVLGLYAAARRGVGLAVLPAYLAEPDDALVRIGGFIDAVETDLWLLTHPDLRHTARVRAVLDHIADSETIRSRLGR